MRGDPISRSGLSPKSFGDFFAPHLEPVFLEKKDLRFHFTVKFEVLKFENRDVPLPYEHSWDRSAPLAV
jgi:hypothetical protein